MARATAGWAGWPGGRDAYIRHVAAVCLGGGLVLDLIGFELLLIFVLVSSIILLTRENAKPTLRLGSARQLGQAECSRNVTGISQADSARRISRQAWASMISLYRN